MPKYRRWRVQGATYFFTVVTHLRRRFLTDPLARRCLREAIATVRAKRPFEIPAIVLLPDHLHAIWNLPIGDADYSVRWRRIKEEFTRQYTKAGGSEGPLTPSRQQRSERGIWQRRFWEHTIQEEHDFERHFDYIHYNPVKHGYVESPKDWPWSSFHKWVDREVYSPDWGRLSGGPLAFDDLNQRQLSWI
jgi:putative transposase